MAIKHGITLSNCVGTIDEDYRGEVCVGIINLSKESYTINPGDRIAQMIIAKVEHVQVSTVSSLDETARAAGGFGSTGYRS
jgi:dUTP pyrophosphatase